MEVIVREVVVPVGMGEVTVLVEGDTVPGVKHHQQRSLQNPCMLLGQLRHQHMRVVGLLPWGEDIARHRVRGRGEGQELVVVEEGKT